MNLAVLYALLLPTNYFVSFFFEEETPEQTKVRTEELAREASDNNAKAELLRNGRKVLVYPKLYDDPNTPFYVLARESAMAPLAPQPNEELVYCNEGYGLVSYRSDRFGFRNPETVWDDEKDLIVIGDSYVHGACVPEEHTIVGGLRRLGIKAVNLGTAANEPIHYAALARTFVRPLHPKAAAIVFYANDNVRDEDRSIFFDLYFKQTPSLADNYMIVDKERLGPSSQLVEFYRRLDPTVQRLTTEHLAGGGEPRSPPTFRDSRTYAYVTLSSLRVPIRTMVERHFGYLPFGTKLAIDTLADSCRVDDRCIPIVAFIPNSDVKRPDPRASLYKEMIRDYVASKHSRVVFVDGAIAIGSLGAQAYAPLGPHLSKAGYSLVSAAIFESYRIALDRRVNSQ